jgi:hypothetical protein
MDVDVVGGIGFRREDPGGESEFGEEETDDAQVQLPERAGMRVQDGKEFIPVIRKKGGGAVGGLDAALGLGHPGG